MFAQARAALDGDPKPAEPSVEERFEICLEHARNGIRFEENPQKSLMDFRKHLGWYTKGLPGGRALRTQLFQITSLDEVEALLEAYLVRHLAGRTRLPDQEAPPYWRGGPSVHPGGVISIHKAYVSCRTAIGRKDIGGVTASTRLVNME